MSSIKTFRGQRDWPQVPAYSVDGILTIMKDYPRAAIYVSHLETFISPLVEELVRRGFQNRPSGIGQERGSFFTIAISPEGVSNVQIEIRTVRKVNRIYVLINADSFSREDILPQQLPQVIEEIEDLRDNYNIYGMSAPRIARAHLRNFGLYGRKPFSLSNGNLSTIDQIHLYNALKPAYNTGMNWNKDGEKESEYEGVSMYDIHSAYPAILSTCKLPVGQPFHLKGVEPKTKFWIATINFYAELKQDGIAQETITNIFSDMFAHYEIRMTSIDWETIKQNYDVCDVEFEDSWSFPDTIDGSKVFAPAIAELYALKESLPHGVKRDVVKTILESIYGSYGMGIYDSNLELMVLDGGILRVKNIQTPKEDIRPSSGYLPIAAFVTAYQRQRMTNLARRYRNIVHITTDSLVFAGYTPQEFIDTEVGPGLGQFGREADDALIGRFLSKYQYALFTADHKISYVYWLGNQDQLLTWENYHRGTRIVKGKKTRVRDKFFNYFPMLEDVILGMGQADSVRDYEFGKFQKGIEQAEKNRNDPNYEGTYHAYYGRYHPSTVSYIETAAFGERLDSVLKKK